MEGDLGRVAGRAVESFFGFQSVAVLGASDDPARVGGAPIHLLRRYGFKGQIHGVNPKRSTVLGERCYASVDEIPGPVELAVVCIPAAAALPELEKLAARGLRAAVVFSGGFAEAGGEGRRRQDELESFGRRHDVAILGPNCAGYVSFVDDRAVTFASQPAMLWQDRPGRIALLSQSGGVAFNAWADALAQGARFSHLVTTGNECGPSFSDFLRHFAADPAVGAVVGYIEGMSDGLAFGRAAHAMQRAGKPVVLLKGGVSSTGREVAGSHTAQISSADSAFQAVCDRYGVIRVSTLQDLNDYAAILSMPNCRGKVTLATNSGGAGVYMADLCERSGVALAQLSDEALARLRTVVPAFGRIRNPVDVTAQVVNDIGILSDCLDVLVDDEATDMLVFALTGKSQPEAARTVIDAFIRASSRTSKPVILCWLGVPEAIRQSARQAGLTVYADPAGFLLPLGACQRALGGEAERDEAGAEPPALPPVKVELEAGQLVESHGLDLLDAAGVACPRRRLVRIGDDLTSAGAALQFPLVMKVARPSIAHKTDRGGVITRIAGPGELLAAAERMRRSIPELEEVMLAEQVPAGVELLVGCMRDPVFGMRVTLAAGGIWAESASDAVTLVPPFTESHLRSGLRRLACWPALSGARGQPPLAIPALVAAVRSIAALFAALPEEIDTFECNPVIVTAEAAVAVDAAGFARKQEERT